MLRERKTIMSGAGALTICDPGYSEPSELEFLCPRSEFDAVREWFQEHKYVVVGTKDAEVPIQELHRDDWVFDEGDEWQYWEVPRVRYNCSDAKRRVLTMWREDQGTTVRVVQSASELAAAPICFYATTLTMNMVTGDGVVCM